MVSNLDTLISEANQTKILLVSHTEKRCGVYQFGLNIGKALKTSSKYSFIYSECSNADELFFAVNQIKPLVIIYNYYPSTLPWLSSKILNKINATHVGMIHEVTQNVADSITNDFFDYHIAPDPTLILRNPLVFKTGRLVQKYVNHYALPEITTIGSFGFGLQGKGFERLIKTVQEEYDEAIIRLNIPFAAFGDANGEQALTIAQRCQDLLVKSGVKLSLSHDFLTQEQLLDFLAQNTLNAFFYQKNEDRGISSVIDYALGVKRPIAITKSNMFRHIFSGHPSLCIENSSLRQIIDNGVAPLEGFCQDWDEANLVYDYELIIDKILNNQKVPKKQFNLKMIAKRNIKKVVLRLLKIDVKGVGTYLAKNQWIQRDAVNTTIENPTFNSKGHLCIDIPNVKSFNRILDNSAREQYRSIVSLLFALVPDIMYRKISEANVQQAFIFDTVQKFVRVLPSPKILCVGSYEDSAALGLKSIGMKIEEIDPVLNFDLNQFFNRPSTIRGSYNVIFSTSVLEHVENDELFISQIGELLAPGGTAILTCDYNDQYHIGDPIPDVDYRFYTQKDFRDRLLPLLKNCSLVDEPQWDCPNPDFVYAGIYRYTFATLVFSKNL
jgi:hypothetical protein